jgi:hypothetical protein
MKTKTILILIGVAALAMTMACTGSFANGAGASNSANYVSDLQNKQESVASIKEDSVNIEKEFARKLNESGVVCTPGGDYSKLDVAAMNLIELIPPSTRINMEAGKAPAALPPEAGTDKSSK